jgi:transposase InsO family protein
MDPDLVAAVARAAAGQTVNVTQVCREHDLSRTTFYRKLARFQDQGAAGLQPRSRAPKTSPTATAEHVVEACVRARKELADQGWDHGAQSVRWRLLDIANSGSPECLDPDEVPSRATIHRLLVARGQVRPQPAKRPRRAWRRFERPAPNMLWQIDGTETVLADGSTAVVVQVSDDHSRLDLASHAARSESAESVWAALQTAFARYGHPACVLSDNGAAFSGRRRGWPMVAVERGLAELGITTIVSSIAHPQTCGKNERLHRTLKQWLAARPAPTDLAELQALLEDYRYGYNQRRHQALDGHTPQQRYDATEPVGPLGPAPGIAGHATRTVSATGVIGFAGTSIGLGRTHAGKTAQLYWQGDRVTILVDDTVATSLTLDHTVRYQRT